MSKLTLFFPLGDGGYLSEVEVHGGDERGELGGGGADPERGGDGLGGGGGLGGGRAVTIKDSIKDLSKLTLFFPLGDGGYLSEVEVHEEDERGELVGGGAVPERGGDGLGGGVGLGGNEKIFLVYKEEEE